MFRNVIYALLLILLPVDAFGRGGVLNILYTGAINGELEPCGCSPETQSGGLARLSGFISSNAEGLKPYILVDAGNSFTEDSPQGRLKSEAILKSFVVMKYDAVALFSPGASVRPDIAERLAGKDMPPVVSDMEGVGRSVRAGRGAFRVNISVDRKGRKKGMLNILLTDRPVSEITGLDGWDAVITSSGELLENPVKADGAIIAAGYPKGQKLGILTVEFDGKGESARFSNRWQPLGKDVKEDAGVRSVLREYDSKVSELTKDADRNVLRQGAYLGASSCAQCHQPYNEIWKGTRHSNAFDSLDKAGKSRDPECVKCHTTGYGEEGGFYSKTATPGLAGVQCESCHGPGRAHVLDLRRMAPVGESACVRCHTESNSPMFNYEFYLERIKH